MATPPEQDAKFQAGVTFVQTSKGIKLDTATQLRFYALYKIAASGPCKVAAPSRLKLVEYQKWQAWSKATKDGVTQATAKELYLKELEAKIPNWNHAKL